MSAPDQLHMLISEKEIADRIAALGAEISQVYQNEPVLVIPVLSGSFVFAADLVRHMTLDIEIAFARASSYDNGTDSSGKVHLSGIDQIAVQDRHVLVIEDIVDTGLTAKALMAELKGRGPASMRLATFLHKPSREKEAVPIDFTGFVIEDRFVVGYGLDFAQRFRQLPYLAHLETQCETSAEAMPEDSALTATDLASKPSTTKDSE